MSKKCADYREQIALLMMEGLDPDEQRSVEDHLAECPVCARERGLYEATLREMGSLENVPVPRHFFVYPQSERNLWQVFLELPLMRRLAMVGGLGLLMLVVGLLVANLRVRVEEGAVVVSLGAAPENVVGPRVSTDQLKAEIVQSIEAAQQQQEERWLAILHAELKIVAAGFSSEQQHLLDVALIDLEERLERRSFRDLAAVQRETGDYVVDALDSLHHQYGQHVRRLDRRIDSLRVWSELESAEKTSILNALLQSNELRVP
ncbi:zf-HC2 domain-containing protein [Acidobacteria bacterium AH-259-G07]|nr:zf-HC2 domain-containing protein [Acidobacteria bacterium AH-259-G07]